MAFCCEMSHVMGAMKEQSWPAGQHMMDEPPLRGMHLVLEGQQKSEGRLDPEHCEKLESGQLLSRTSKLPAKARVAKHTKIETILRFMVMIMFGYEEWIGA